MNKLLIAVALLGSVAIVMLVIRDHADIAEVKSPEVDNALLARVEALEDLVSFHSHHRDLEGIVERLQALESMPADDRPTPHVNETASQAKASPSQREFSDLKRDVQSLSSKLSTLERSVSPLKQDIAKLRLTLMRVESNVARVDLRR